MRVVTWPRRWASATGRPGLTTRWSQWPLPLEILVEIWNLRGQIAVVSQPTVAVAQL